MKKKNYLLTLACVGLLAAAVAPMSVLAEETEIETEAEATAAARPEYTALDYVTLGEYKGLTVQVASVAVTDEEVQAEVEANISTYASETLTEGTVQVGDIANIDYVGTMDGEEFDGGSSEGYDLEIGSGTFIDGFEDGLVGVAIGDTVDLNLTFPEDYYYTDLAGVEVVFTVTVNSVERTPEEITDEVVSTATGGEYTDLESYSEYVRAYLEEDAESDWAYEVQTALIEALAAGSEITGYPQELVDFSLQQAIDYYTDYAEYFSMTYEELIEAFGYDEETFVSLLEESIKANLDEELLLRAVIESEGLELTDEEYQAGVEEYATYYGYSSTDDFVADYEEYYGTGTMRLALELNRALDFVQENAVVEEPVEEETEAETE